MLALTLVGLLGAPLIVDAMGASASVRPFALTYLRIGLLGAPALLIALAATGYLRGLQDTRTPLVIAVAANVFNLALEVLLVYGFHLGIAGFGVGHGDRAVSRRSPRTSIVVGRNVRRVACVGPAESGRTSRPPRSSAATSPSAPRRCSRCSS